MAEAARRALPDVDAKGAHFVIVEGRYYDDLNNKLIAGARAAFEKAGASVEVITMPGALEIPIAIEGIRQQAEDGLRRADGFVALGVVIRGETTHYEIVSNESARDILDVQLETGVPIANGVLTTSTEEQARERASVKGAVAARVAVGIANTLKAVTG